MAFLRFALRRAAPAATTAGVGAWATITTINDDWDDYTPRFLLPSATNNSSSNDNNNNQPEKIVILGSGWAGLNALRKIAGPNKDIVVVSPRPHFLYTPLLAGSAVGTITLRSAIEPIRALVENAATKASSATFVRADARDIDVETKTVCATTGGDGMQLELSYDKLIIAVGAMPNTFGIPGVHENALFLKEADDSAKLHAKLLSNLEKATALIHHGSRKDLEETEREIDRLLKVVVVGGGPTGVELAAELADFAQYDVAKRYGQDVSDRIQIVLVEALPRILGPFDESLANVAKDHLISRGVDVRTGVAITKVNATDATFAPSTPRNATPEDKARALSQAVTEETGAVVWAAGIGSRPLVKKLAKSLGQSDVRGLKVDSALRVEGTQGTVYAIGDAALSGCAPTAQVAAQQGKHVGRSIRDNTDAPFVYQHAGSLCCLGNGNGIAQLLVPSNSKFNIWDAIGAPTVGPNNDQRAVTGTPAFVLWRSLYWTKLLSTSSRLSLTTDWIKAQFSGRDVVEPVLKRNPTIARRLTTMAKSKVESFGTPLKRNPTVQFVKEKTEEAAAVRTKRFWLF